MVCRLSLALLLIAVTAGAARAEESFFLLMFSSQRMPRNPNYAHSFATFVRASCGGPGAGTVLEAHTISWLPANLCIRTFALLPECGQNFDLDTTLHYTLENKERVSLWGPYRIDPELYRRAINQIAQLESGRVLYKADDTFYRSDRVSNCVHAVSVLSEGYRLRMLSPGWGDTASYFILLELRPWVLDEMRHAWISSALGLDRYPISYREPPPQQGPIPPLTGLPLLLQGPVPRPSYGPPH
jgi:hypothetical protein